MSNFAQTLSNIMQKRVASGYKYQGYPAYSLTVSDAKKIEDIANKYGFPPEWMANQINLESAATFNPAIRNSIGATGLIQFLPSTAQGLGTSTSELSKMTFKEQMEYVDKYLKNYFIRTGSKRGLFDETKGKVTNKFTIEDLFMIIFYPAATGIKDYIFPNAVSKANGGITTPKEYAEHALKRSTTPFPLVKSSIENSAKAIIKSPGKSLAITIGILGVGIGLFFILKKK